MLSDVFHKHGRFCAAHPLEVVVSTVTVIVSLMSLQPVAHDDRVCGWNYRCAKEQDVVSGSDVVILSLARCVALIYIYVQFRNLRRLGSKYLLGISGLFTIFSSFIFCIAVVKLFGNTMSGLYEALPFFLVLIDLSKASALAVFALSSTSRQEIHQNIAQGMSLLGPAITLDAIVETLAIGIGTLSGVKQLETMCCFGCLSVMANYFLFMTFYPACLALVLELSRGSSEEKDLGQYKHLVELIREEHIDKKPNPVTQKVKIIMSVGLAAVHIHSRLIVPIMKDESEVLTADLDAANKYTQPEMSIWQFYLYRMFAVHVDYGFTLLLAIVLLVKYIYIDGQHDLEMQHVLDLTASQLSMAASSPSQLSLSREHSGSIDRDLTESGSRPSFTIGDADEEDQEKELETSATQTDLNLRHFPPLTRLPSQHTPRPIPECLEILRSDAGAKELSDEEILSLVKAKHIPAYKLEGMLGDFERGVAIRRQLILDQLHTPEALELLPYTDFDYTNVDGACCENVVGYMPVPVGVAGPLLLDGNLLQVPMATTEGCLVASTNRGCRALQQSGGVHSVVNGDGMTRGPAVRFPSARRASEAKLWLEDVDNYAKVKESFDLTSRFARLFKLGVAQAGRLLYIRFVGQTGDAMGMNMLSKGTERGLRTLHDHFPDMEILSLSGNYCTDKKPAAINWIEGRGKSVVCEAVIPADVVKGTLKTSVHALVDLNISKNLVGSAMAGSIGGFNAHASNIVTAIFIATGQDPAQSVTSGNCLTQMEPWGPDNQDLYISCTMPSIEVGTVGGGTVLPPQAACLKMLGVQGSNDVCPGENARQLARIVCGTVLAGELSLMAALAAGHLVRSHLRHNRSSMFIGSSSPSGLDKTGKESSDFSQTSSSHHRQSCPSLPLNRLRLQKSPSPTLSKTPAMNSEIRDNLASVSDRWPVKTVTGSRLGAPRNHPTGLQAGLSADQGDIGSCIKHVS